jgi:hypothetical protein
VGGAARSNGLEHSLTDTVPAAVAGRRAVLGVRSEHVILGDGAPLKGTVQLTEPLGDTTLVHFDSTAGNRLVAKVGPSTALQPRAALRFNFYPHPTAPPPRARRCGFAPLIGEELRKKKPEHFVDERSLADIHASLERAADIL